MVKSIRELEEELFKRWRSEMPLEDSWRFVRDGLICEKCYLTSKPKILLILKDAYFNPKDEILLSEEEKKELVADSDYILKIKDHIFDNLANGPTWVTISRWVYGLQNLGSTLSWGNVYKNSTPKHARVHLLKTIGSMNLKKTASYGYNTNHQKLKDEAKDYSKFIKEQWELYDSEISICGGPEVFKLFAQIMNIEITEGQQYFWLNNKKLIICSPTHPASRQKAKVKFTDVIRLASHLLNKQTTLTD